jgi:hypothetical protein
MSSVECPNGSDDRCWNFRCGVLVAAFLNQRAEQMIGKGLGHLSISLVQNDFVSAQVSVHGVFQLRAQCVGVRARQGPALSHQNEQWVFSATFGWCHGIIAIAEPYCAAVVRTEYPVVRSPVQSNAPRAPVPGTPRAPCLPPNATAPSVSTSGAARIDAPFGSGPVARYPWVQR